MALWGYLGTNLMKAALGKTYTHDQNGNPITCSDGREFDYDYENRLTRLTSSAYRSDFVYNGFGDRIKKTHQTFTNNNSVPPDEEALIKVLSELKEANKGKNADIFYDEFKDMSESRSLTTNEYVYDDLGRQIFWKRTIDGNVTNVYYSYGYGMEARRVNSSMNYLHSDILGSITAITNASGSAMSTYEYDPYGIMLSGNTNVLGNFGFTGQEIDLETGDYHFPARYYEPYWGRFLTPDPLAGIQMSPDNCPMEKVKFKPSRLNQYVYVSNNPVNFVDPLGLFEKLPGETFKKCYDRCVNSPEMIRANEIMWEWSGAKDIERTIAEIILTTGAEKVGEKGLTWFAKWLAENAVKKGRNIVIPFVERPFSTISRWGASGFKFLGAVGDIVLIGQAGLLVGWTITGPYGNLPCAMLCGGEPNASLPYPPPNYE